MTTKEVIENFYNGLAQKHDTWQRDLSDNVVFADASNKLHAEGKDMFIKAFTPFLQGVEQIAVKQLIIENTDGCAVISYDYVSPKGGRLHQDDAEVWKVVDGKIVSLTIYFDITEFRNFMRG